MMSFSRNRFLVGFFIVGFVITAVGCGTASRQQLLEADESQVSLRNMQTRAFDTADKSKMMRSTISTLQDLEFLILDADADLGTLTAQKFSRNRIVKISVTVRSRNASQLLVRANLQDGLRAVEYPEPYQDFFTSLEKSLFLTAHQVD